MDPNRWQQVDHILNQAAGLGETERERFLRSACAGDDSLEKEVRSLLEAGQAAGSFLERPAAPEGGQISHYRILEEIGSGGMGVVYKAEDTRLGRFVALKFISESLARNPEAVLRFRREAQAASALSHPNISTVFDIDEKDGRLFLVMEYLDGETLKDRIARGPLSEPECIAYSIQIASALEAAHAAHIVHRDIKPGNLFLTADGRVKVLDFGLAQWRPPGSAAEAITSLTLAGHVVGTQFYMSPEQAAGRPLDGRSDLFSFGLTLFEMATGRRCTGAVSTGQLPAALSPLIAKCTELDPDARFQTAAEVREALEHLRSPAPLRSSLRRPLPVAAGVALVLAIAGGGAWYAVSHRGTAGPRHRVVIGAFEDPLRDLPLDTVLRTTLSAAFSGSERLETLSETRVASILRLMTLQPDTPLTPQIALEVCERAGGSAVVDTSLAPVGDRVILSVRASDCPSRRPLGEEQAETRKEDVRNSLVQVAARIRQRIESATAGAVPPQPLPEFTTRSLEALKAYQAALKTLSTSDFAKALVAIERAVELDPEFAMAHALAGRLHSDGDETELAVESMLRAYQLRDRVSEPERFFITFNYQRDVLRNLELCDQTLESWMRRFPQDSYPLSFRSGLTSVGRAEYEESLAAAHAAIALNPSAAAIAYLNGAWSALYLNRLSESKAFDAQSAGRGLSSEEWVILRYWLAFVEGDRAGMERQSANKSLLQGVVPFHTSLFAAYEGRVHEARLLARSAVDMAAHARMKERSALFAGGFAAWEALYGNRAEAVALAHEALQTARNPDAGFPIALALAWTGSAGEARRIISDMARSRPEDTLARFLYIPILNAVVARNNGQAARAVEISQASAAFDFAQSGSILVGPFGAGYLPFVRGLAYRDLGRHAEAAGEFRRIVDHRSIILGDPMGALAQLELGKALKRSGDRNGAAAALKAAIENWKRADPDFRPLAEAKAELAGL